MRYIVYRRVKKSDKGAALINLDQSKAFDRVDHQYQAAVLTTAVFGSVFRGWIAVIYSDICSAVGVNGHLSEPFYIVRSVCQGSQLLSLLYLPTLEPLLQKRETLRGILRELGRGRVMSVYANGINVTMSDDIYYEIL